MEGVGEREGKNGGREEKGGEEGGRGKRGRKMKEGTTRVYQKDIAGWTES